MREVEDKDFLLQGPIFWKEEFYVEPFMDLGY